MGIIRRLRNGKGMTYIEIVIAMAIISYIAVAFGQFFILMAMNVIQTKHKTLAYDWATDTMEYIKAQSFSDITQPNLDAAVNGSRELAPGKVFTRQATVTSESSDLKRIDISITWTEMGRTRQLNINSYIADVV